MGKRDIRKEVKFSKDEYNAVCKKASAVNMKVGTYIRVISVQGNIKVFPFKELDNVYRALNRIGVNLNQITTVVNSTGGVYQKDMEDIQAEMKRLKTIVENWLSPIMPEEIL